jgi:hypothetical protein
MISNSEDMTEHHEDMAEHHEDMSEHHEDITEHHENMTEHHEDMTDHPEDMTEHHEDISCQKHSSVQEFLTSILHISYLFFIFSNIFVFDSEIKPRMADARLSESG